MSESGVYSWKHAAESNHSNEQVYLFIYFFVSLTFYIYRKELQLFHLQFLFDLASSGISGTILINC